MLTCPHHVCKVLLKGPQLSTTMPGIQQRLNAARADAPLVHDVPVKVRANPSHLVTLLVGLWAWGLMSPQTIQKIVGAALKDIENVVADPQYVTQLRDAYEDIASMGAHGNHVNNISRDLFRKLGDSFLETLTTRVPVKLGRGSIDGAAYLASTAMLLPHMLFATMGAKYKAAYNRIIRPSTERVEAFWHAMRGNPQLEGVNLCEPIQLY